MSDNSVTEQRLYRAFCGGDTLSRYRRESVGLKAHRKAMSGTYSPLDTLRLLALSESLGRPYEGSDDG